MTKCDTDIQPRLRKTRPGRSTIMGSALVTRDSEHATVMVFSNWRLLHHPGTLSCPRSLSRPQTLATVKIPRPTNGSRSMACSLIKTGSERGVRRSIGRSAMSSSVKASKIDSRTLHSLACHREQSWRWKVLLQAAGGGAVPWSPYLGSYLYACLTEEQPDPCAPRPWCR